MIKTYKDLKGRTWNQPVIPKWIFKTGPFEVNELPEIYKHLFLDMLEKNPGYELFYFSDKDCMLYIHNNYGEEYFRTYDNVIPTAYKADFWRYLILFKHGGCYGDFSQVMLTSFDSIIEGMDRVFVRDTPDYSDCLYNAFMCNKPGDDVVRRAIDKTKENIDNKHYGSNLLDVTGPRVLGRAYCEVIYNNTKSIIDAGVFGTTKILNNIEMEGNFIVDENEKPLILRKLSNHYYSVYINRGVTHYSHLWNERKVFK
jgi:mannosyltransferase OCH1-like enzyme